MENKLEEKENKVEENKLEENKVEEKKDEKKYKINNIYDIQYWEKNLKWTKQNL